MTGKTSIAALATLCILSTAAGCSGRVTGPTATVEIPAVTLDPSEFRADNSFLTVRLPEGWAGVEGPELVAPLHIEGLVAFNSWGEEEFWARSVESPRGSTTYSPETVMSQMPDGGAYAVLTRITLPTIPGSEPGEYKRRDLGGLEDLRSPVSEGYLYASFYKWGRNLSISAYHKPDASDATIAALDALLDSWRFDAVPAGDPEWAGIEARKSLPSGVQPQLFSIRASRSAGEVTRITEVEVRDKTVRFRFIYGWDGVEIPKSIPDDFTSELWHWWRVDVLPSGEVVLVVEGGAQPYR